LRASKNESNESKQSITTTGRNFVPTSTTTTTTTTTPHDTTNHKKGNKIVHQITMTSTKAPIASIISPQDVESLAMSTVKCIQDFIEILRDVFPSNNKMMMMVKAAATTNTRSNDLSADKPAVQLYPHIIVETHGKFQNQIRSVKQQYQTVFDDIDDQGEIICSPNNSDDNTNHND
jgi:hypothetical protein